MVFGLLRIGSDLIAVTAAILFAYLLRTKNVDLIPNVQFLEPSTTLPNFTTYVQTFLPPSLALFLVIAALLKLYLIRITLSAFRELSRIALATIVWIGIIMGWYFMVRKQLFYSRAILVHATIFVAMLVSFGRTMLTIVQRRLLLRGIGVRSVLTFGIQELPRHVEAYLKRDPRYQYLGHIHPVGALHATPLRDVISKQPIDLVLQTDPSSSDETNEVIDFCRSHHIGYAFLPPVLVDTPHLLSVYRFGSVPVLRFTPTPLDGWGMIFKRAIDISVSTFLLILLFPVFLLIATLIKLDSPGPVFYKSKRMGHRFHSIHIWKHRSMVKNADAMKEELKEKSHREDGPLFKIKDDPRVTRIGTFLRRFSLDELPQLWNVLRGDLSLVGPRPHLPEEVEKYTDFQKRVFAVKPGVTGLAQISGRSDLPFEEEVRLDLQYIEEWSPWMDMWILWRTMGVVMKGEGAD
jgi:exopolysaccharide biosynthesis polyprenyl glycosylphosphotransferase